MFEELLVGASLPTLACIVYYAMELLKGLTKHNESVLTYIPTIAAAFGSVCGLIAFFFVPDFLPTDNILVAALIGCASGLAATGLHQNVKQLKK